MVTLSISIPEELREKMDKFDEINWSAVARKAFEIKLQQMELLKQIVEKSKLKKEDVERLSVEIDKKISEKFVNMD